MPNTPDRTRGPHLDEHTGAAAAGPYGAGPARGSADSIHEPRASPHIGGRLARCEPARRARATKAAACKRHLEPHRGPIWGCKPFSDGPDCASKTRANTPNAAMRGPAWEPNAIGARPFRREGRMRSPPQERQPASLEGQETHDERASFQRRTRANTPSAWGYRRSSICNKERAAGGSHANLPTKAKAKAGPPCSGPRCAGGGSAYAHGRARSPHPAARKGCPRTRNCEDGANWANGAQNTKRREMQ